MVQKWEIVGGGDKGGILVRAGESTGSKGLADRLSTGAIVEQLAVVGDRLHYKLISGTGPAEGWVAIRLPDKVLCVKVDDSKLESKTPKVVCSSAEEWLARPHPAEKRCLAEWAKDSPQWPGIAMEQFQANYMNNEPGTRYGFKFPHSIEQLESKEYGAAWLTKAFRASTVLGADNSVKKIVSVKQLGGGGAADKALVVLEYANPSPDLHEKIFMKFPYPMEGARRSDRMNSSALLQQDCMEVDALRLLEASLPFRVTKYYYADISPVTSNFISLTEFVNYGDPKKPLKDFVPWEVEPPYEKFLDDEQWTDPWEYYKEMTRAVATMAGYFKAGKFGEPSAIEKYFPNSKWGLPQGPMMDERTFQMKMKMGVEFITQSAKVLFPPDTITPEAMKEWQDVMNISNAYTAELAYFSHGHEHDNYMVLMHGNMNADNTFWTRDEDGKLHIGVVDWGGLGVGAFPQKLWWCNYAAEFHFFEKHLDEMLKLFCDTYKESGGPEVDLADVKFHFLMSAVNQCLGLLGAIPQIYRVVSKKIWPEVKDRNYPKLKEHFLTRMYVQGFVLIVTMIKRWNIKGQLEAFIAEKQLPPKPMIPLP